MKAYPILVAPTFSEKAAIGHTVSNPKARKVSVVAIPSGERRVPLKGEWYIDPILKAARRATAGMLGSFAIATLGPVLN